MKEVGTQRSTIRTLLSAHSKKGQIEIMGLVVIVILVTLGMFFTVALRSNEPTQATTIYTDERLSGDFLITLLKANAKDCEAELEDLARDAVLQIMDRNRYSCGGVDSRTYFNETLDTIVDDTLHLWGRDFELNFSYEYSDETITLYHRREGCRVGQEKNAPGFQAIHLYPEAHGTALLTLSLCN